MIWYKTQAGARNFWDGRMNFPDVVILDGNVPEDKGQSATSTVELARMVLADDTYDGAVIAFSGKPASQQELMDAGCHHGVPKPALGGVLLAIIEGCRQ